MPLGKALRVLGVLKKTKPVNPEEMSDEDLELHLEEESKAATKLALDEQYGRATRSDVIRKGLEIERLRKLRQDKLRAKATQ